MEIGFKIVNTHSEFPKTLLSYNIPRCSDALKDKLRTGEVIIYREGLWTTPVRGCGPLALFERFRDAKNFSSEVEAQIWLVEYVPSEAKEQWVSGREYGDEYRIFEEVKGEVFADAIKLTRRMQ